MQEGSYVCIQSFMVNDLKLKGNELIVYAVIHGYTQDGEHWYYGTRAHLAEWCGATKTTVSNCLKSLVEKGFIIRREVERYGSVQVQYQVVLQGATKKQDTPIKNCDTTLQENCTIDIKETNTNNNTNNRFIPPTAGQVESYMLERGTPIDAESFCDYWESVGWIRGKTKMKDWKAAARQWHRNDSRYRKGGNDAEVGEYAGQLNF